MKKSIFILLLLVAGVVQAQNKPSKAHIDGAYTALVAERGASGPTKNKVIQLVENNGTQMLAVAACAKCFPALYTYKPKMSKQFGKPVFYNSMGLYLLTYDQESFVIVMLDLTFKENFSYHNFYSKSNEKVKTMSKKKVEAYAIKLLDYL